MLEKTKRSIAITLLAILSGFVLCIGIVSTIVYETNKDQGKLCETKISGGLLLYASDFLLFPFLLFFVCLIQVDSSMWDNDENNDRYKKYLRLCFLGMVLIFSNSGSSAYSFIKHDSCYDSLIISNPLMIYIAIIHIAMYSIIISIAVIIIIVTCVQYCIIHYHTNRIAEQSPLLPQSNTTGSDYCLKTHGYESYNTY